MKKFILLLVLFIIAESHATVITTISRTNAAANSILTSATYNADLNTSYTAINDIISVAFKGLQSGCGLGYIDANTIKVKNCILGVSGKFFQTATSTNISWGCTDCSTESTNAYFYVYIKNDATFTPYISGQTPQDDGYDASGSKVLGRFYNDATGEIYSATITDWSVNGFVDRNSVFDMPIGSIVPSMLTEVQFQTINGTGWELADGGSVAGSTYATMTGNSNSPDLRGQFLRGKNNSRSDGKENATGDSALGAYQADGNKTHNHTASITAQGIGRAADFDRTGASGGYTGDGPTSTVNLAAVTVTNTADGNTEATVRNVTVNYFIRIN